MQVIHTMININMITTIITGTIIDTSTTLVLPILLVPLVGDVLPTLLVPLVGDSIVQKLQYQMDGIRSPLLMGCTN